MAANALYMSAPLIVVVLIIDYLAGDPSWLPHPVRFIGRAIAWGDAHLWSGHPQRDFIAGLILAVGVTVLAAGSVWAGIALCGQAAWWLATLAAVIVAWTTIAMRGLDDAAQEVERTLLSGDDAAARAAIPALVGRDPHRLDRTDLVAATVESVAENFNDGVVAPLFFLFLGGPVCAMGYKAINTLDSMIGYRNDRYVYFGRAAARLDDAANYIAARLSALCIIAAAALVTARAGSALKTCLADARKHASPNAGYPEAAMAGALGIKLGGDAIYAGEVEHRPILDGGNRAIAAEDITTARQILHCGCVIAVV